MEQNMDNQEQAKIDGGQEQTVEKDGSNLPERRVIRTVVLYVTFFIFGFAVSPIGPTLPNMEVLLQTDTSYISMALSANSVGFLVGSLLCAVLFDRINPELQLSLSMCIMGTSLLAAPWSTNVHGFTAALAFYGLGLGYIDAGGNAHLLHMWDGHLSQKVLFLGIQVVFTIGTTVAPYAIKPFLVDINHREPSNCSSEVYTENSTALYTSLLNCSAYERNSTSSSDVISVRYAYMLVGACALCVSALELVLYCSVGPYLFRNKSARRNPDETEGSRNTDTITQTYKHLMTGFMSLFTFLYISTQHIPKGFTALCVTEYLGWPVKSGAVLTAVYWGGQGLGCIAAVPASYMLSSRMIVYVSLVLICLAYTLMLFISKMGDIIVYVSLALGGFAVAPIYANSILWVSNFIKPSGFVIGSLACAISLSGMVMSPLTAHCFVTLGYMWFVYILLILGVTSLFFFVLMELYANLARTKKVVQESIDLIDK